MASPKARDYFITVNENAECYAQALDITKELNYTLYAHIIHDSDMLYNENTGEYTPKRTHQHIVIELKNPVSFQSIQNKFPGAHIERVKYKKAAYQYLLHESPHSGEKYHYGIECITSNNIAAVKAAIEAEEGLEIFAENQFMLYIAQGCTTAFRFVKRFGLNVYKQYWKSYQDMLALIDHDQEMTAELKTLKASLEAEQFEAGEKDTLRRASELFGDDFDIDGTDGTEQPR